MRNKISELKDIYNSYCHAAWYDWQESGLPLAHRLHYLFYVIAFFDLVFDAVHHYGLAQRCALIGHEWIDDGSSAGPEGAADYLVCAHCGIGFTHRYF